MPEKFTFDPKAVEIDKEGRLVFKDKALADKIKEALAGGQIGNPAAMLDVNFGCGKS